jgi:hypothetical protein
MNKTSIITQLNRQDIERLREYRELLDFYHGRQWEGRERRGEKRLTFNYTKVFIDKVTSYLMSGVNFSVEAGGARRRIKAEPREPKPPCARSTRIIIWSSLTWRRRLIALFWAMAAIRLSGTGRGRG